MDISNLSRDELRTFSVIYETATAEYGESFDALSPDALHAIRVKIQETRIDSYNSEWISALYEYSDKEFVDFFRKCYELDIEVKKSEIENLHRVCEGLGGDLTEAFEYITDCDTEIFCGSVKRRGDTLIIPVHTCGSSVTFISVQTTDEFPTGEYEVIFFELASFRREGDEFSIAYSFYGENRSVLRFTSPSLKTVVYNATTYYVQSDSIWNYLFSVARNILYKTSNIQVVLNEKEEALLPLIRELSGLFFYTIRPHMLVDPDFSELKKLACRFSLPKLKKNLDKITESSKKRKKANRVTWFQTEFNSIEYEPLWRYIYNELCISQAEYGSNLTGCNTPAILRRREIIEKCLHEQGYSGEYPDFHKVADIKGVHLTDSYGQLYLTVNEKNAVCRIHCIEVGDEDHPTIQFISGTAFPKKDEKIEDIFSCMFSAKGRRIYKSTRLADLEDNEEKIKTVVGASVKRAELKRLAKHEKGTVVSHVKTPVTYFVMFFLIAVLFGAGMTAAGIIITAVFTADLGSVSHVLASIPWWLIFIGSGAGFSGIMTLLSYLADRK